MSTNGTKEPHCDSMDRTNRRVTFAKEPSIHLLQETDYSAERDAAQLAEMDDIQRRELLKAAHRERRAHRRTTMTATLEDGGGGGGGGGEEELVINTAPSLATRLNKRADLLRRILSFHKIRNPKDYINLRSSSKLFHRALPQPPPLWTSFPHSNHATLQSLVDRLEQLRDSEESSGNVPSVLFIEEGEYSAEDCAEGEYVRVKKPLSIYGAGRGKTTLVGVGLWIEGNKSEGIVEIEDLTIKGGGGSGLEAESGMNVIMRGITVEFCLYNGVVADGADITCDDLQVIGCGRSGVVAGNNATITLSGQGTKIQGNVTKGNSRYYGMETNSYSWSRLGYPLQGDSKNSKIQLFAPLTKKQISTNNGGGGNWGVSFGKGTIEQVSKKSPTVLAKGTTFGR